MWGESLFLKFLVGIAAVAGFAAGALLTRMLGSIANRPIGKRADELHHRIRGLEADLRVAHRNAEQVKTERDALQAELGKTAAELVALKDQMASHTEIIQKLKAEVQHECAKTARLRHELADRAEEMVRTHVQLRDVQNELGVSQVGSDVVIDQIKRLERERDDLSTMLDELRKEVAARPAGKQTSGSAKARDLGDNLLVDC